MGGRAGLPVQGLGGSGTTSRHPHPGKVRRVAPGKSPGIRRHEAGDQLLRAVGRRLRLFTRESDTLARLGGDEFGIVLTGLQEEDGIGRAIQRIMDSF
ncbi:MAG: diguanylate cyclase, partial [Nitrospirae bacterium]|nr:diguanylate cyclase [Nitrospirota bacterium]